MAEQKAPFCVSDKTGLYAVNRPVSADEIIAFSVELLERRLHHGREFYCAQDTAQFLIAKMGAYEREVFACLFLDNRHRLLAYEELFFGTIDGASVYPREVVKRGLLLNAAAVILAHCHPSGVAEPSHADRQVTQKVINALSFIDMRVLDHIVVGGTTTVSFAERGYI